MLRAVLWYADYVGGCLYHISALEKRLNFSVQSFIMLPAGYVAAGEPANDAIEKFDEVYIVGEAASHCLMESGRQILEHFAGRPDITQRITILEDCTSPIPGYESATHDAFESFKATYGIKVMKSTDVIL